MIILNCLSLIILIIFEISITLFLVLKLTKCEKKIEKINEKMLLSADIVIKMCSKIKGIVLKTNKIVSILTNKKLLRVHTFLKYVLNIAEIVIFVRTLDFSKGFKKSFNYKNIKKILFAKVTKDLIYKILSSVCV